MSRFNQSVSVLLVLALIAGPGPRIIPAMAQSARPGTSATGWEDTYAKTDDILTKNLMSYTARMACQESVHPDNIFVALWLVEGIQEDNLSDPQNRNVPLKSSYQLFFTSIENTVLSLQKMPKEVPDTVRADAFARLKVKLDAMLANWKTIGANSTVGGANELREAVQRMADYFAGKPLALPRADDARIVGNDALARFRSAAEKVLQGTGSIDDFVKAKPKNLPSTPTDPEALKQIQVVTEITAAVLDHVQNDPNLSKEQKANQVQEVVREMNEWVSLAMECQVFMPPNVAAVKTGILATLATILQGIDLGISLFGGGDNDDDNNNGPGDPKKEKRDEARKATAGGVSDAGQKQQDYEKQQFSDAKNDLNDKRSRQDGIVKADQASGNGAALKDAQAKLGRIDGALQQVDQAQHKWDNARTTDERQAALQDLERARQLGSDLPPSEGAVCPIPAPKPGVKFDEIPSDPNAFQLQKDKLQEAAIIKAISSTLPSKASNDELKSLIALLNKQMPAGAPQITISIDGERTQIERNGRTDAVYVQGVKQRS